MLLLINPKSWNLSMDESFKMSQAFLCSLFVYG